jgi:uracil phosphoribosyltransferase
MFVLNAVNSVANQLFLELRGKETQLNRRIFKSNLEKLGQIMAYELSKSLEYKQTTVKTVLGESSINIIKEQPVLFTIIRAGLPFLNGFQNYFDRSDCGFIGAQRIEGKKEDNQASLGYYSIAPFDGKDLIVVDPMLATGNSLKASLEVILKKGNPGMLHLVFAIASPEGIEKIKQSVNVPYRLWVGAVDERLNQKGYIVPGLGDAGDLIFGIKI